MNNKLNLSDDIDLRIFGFSERLLREIGELRKRIQSRCL